MEETSAGIIVFRVAEEERLYLLLHYHYKGDYWGFPRGNVREGERLSEAALRETREETGLQEGQISLIEGFEESTSWFYIRNGKRVRKKVTYFLAKTEIENIDISEEHVGYRWLNFKDSIRILKFKSSKNLVVKAEKFLLALAEKGSSTL